MIRGVLFDMDGTLIDTEKTYYRAWHRAAELTDYGGDIDADLLAFSGKNLEGFYEYYRSVWGERYDPTKMLALRNRLVEEWLTRDGIFPMPGAVACLQELGRMGIAVAVATSSERSRAERYLRAAGLLAFTAVSAPTSQIGGKETTSGKRTAQRTVDEYFHLQRVISYGGGQIRQGSLPGDHEAGKAKRRQNLPHRGIVPR